MTKTQFASFVADTDYVTAWERALDPTLYPGVAEGDLQPGGPVFRAALGPVDPQDWRQWWEWVVGAYWRLPHGLGSDLSGKSQHPVVQVSVEDAQAYATRRCARR